MTGSEGARPSGSNRRTVVKGAAWAVPAVAVAAAAPAYAASCIPVITLGPTSCKCPGQSTGDPWTYFLTFCVDLTGCPPQDVQTFTISKVASKSGGPGGTPLGTPNGNPYPIQVPIVNGKGCSTEVKFTSTNSANFLLISYSLNSGATQVAEVPSPPDCTNCASRV